MAKGWPGYRDDSGTSRGLGGQIVSDIEMPRIDEFYRTQHLQVDPQYARLPGVLVTSPDAWEPKARRMGAGMGPYIVIERV